MVSKSIYLKQGVRLVVARELDVRDGLVVLLAAEEWVEVLRVQQVITIGYLLGFETIV